MDFLPVALVTIFFTRDLLLGQFANIGCPIAETKGRTYAELDILFENKVPARKFASTKIENLVHGTESAQKEQVEHIISNVETRAQIRE